MDTIKYFSLKELSCGHTEVYSFFKNEKTAFFPSRIKSDQLGDSGLFLENAEAGRK